MAMLVICVQKQINVRIRKSVQTMNIVLCTEQQFHTFNSLLFYTLTDKQPRYNVYILLDEIH